MSDFALAFPSRRDYLGALSLPIAVLILIPGIILWLSDGFPLDPYHVFSFYAKPGLALITIGSVMMLLCILHFSKTGNGTLAPWAPTQKLVVTGLYSYVRNPMILGVLIILLGEAVYFTSLYVLVWFLFLFVGNHVYFIKSEEPGLVKRFGQDYIKYQENVTRWIPRRTAWNPESAAE